MTANSTTEHDEGFAAGIEAAATQAEHDADYAERERPDWYTAIESLRATAAAIRALKPAPRSAEHTAEPSAQERERFEAWFGNRFFRTNFERNSVGQYEDSTAEIAWQSYAAALATAPSPCIEAEAVCPGCGETWPASAIGSECGSCSSLVGGIIIAAPPARTPDARSTMAAQPAADEPSIEAEPVFEDETRCDVPPRGWVCTRSHGHGGSCAAWPQSTFDWTEDFGHENGNYECECVHCKVRFYGHKRRVCCKVCYFAESPDAPVAQADARSTDSSAEAAGMERAAKWVDDRADAYDRDHGTTDPDTGTRWWPGDGEDYMFELDEIATGIRAEAAKLTTAPHTEDETRVDGGA